MANGCVRLESHGTTAVLLYHTPTQHDTQRETIRVFTHLQQFAPASKLWLAMRLSSFNSLFCWCTTAVHVGNGWNRQPLVFNFTNVSSSYWYILASRLCTLNEPYRQTLILPLATVFLYTAGGISVLSYYHSCRTAVSSTFSSLCQFFCHASRRHFFGRALW